MNAAGIKDRDTAMQRTVGTSNVKESVDDMTVVCTGFRGRCGSGGRKLTRSVWREQGLYTSHASTEVFVDKRIES